MITQGIVGSKLNNIKTNLKSGFTLIELVISIVLIALAFLGIILAVQTATRGTGDPMIIQQAIAIAESYAEEISSKTFPTSGTGACPAPPAGGRANYANVCDYAAIGTQAPTDETGNAIAALSGYSVTVGIVVSGFSFVINGNTLAAGTDVVRIDLAISHSSMQTLNVSVYRGNY